jgi:CheY-like chemotaxis protein
MEPTRSGSCRERGLSLTSYILLDMMMPRMDGRTFVDQQVKNPAIAGIPVVVLSAAPRDVLRGVRAAAILQKPLNF